MEKKIGVIEELKIRMKDIHKETTNKVKAGKRKTEILDKENNKTEMPTTFNFIQYLFSRFAARDEKRASRRFSDRERKILEFDLHG